MRDVLRAIPERRSKRSEVNYESYGFVGEESRVHFEFRARKTSRERMKMRVAIEACIFIVGLSCGAIAGAMNLAAAHIHLGV